MIRITTFFVIGLLALGLSACGDRASYSNGDYAAENGDNAKASAAGNTRNASVVWNAQALPLGERIACPRGSIDVITAINRDGGIDFWVRYERGYRDDPGKLESVNLMVGDEEYSSEFGSSELEGVEFQSGSHTRGIITLLPENAAARAALPDGALIEFDVRC